MSKLHAPEISEQNVNQSLAGTADAQSDHQRFCIALVYKRVIGEVTTYLTQASFVAVGPFHAWRNCVLAHQHAAVASTDAEATERSA